MHLSWERCLGKRMPSGRLRDYRGGIRIACRTNVEIRPHGIFDEVPQPNCGEDLKSSDCTTLLRLVICGSVDDGKSTLLGRLLHESKMTARRKFVVADTPGREQPTREIVSGASSADLAIVLIDARKGLLTETRRYTYLVSLLGVRHVVLTVNKMDLVDYSPSVFSLIEDEYREFAKQTKLDDVTCIPLSAAQGDNIVEPRGNTPWYRGPMLMEHLETVAIEENSITRSFRMPVQSVNRPSLDFRGYAGTIASG